MFQFGSWLLRLDDIEAVMVNTIPDNNYKMIVRMRNGKEYSLLCKTWEEYEKNKTSIYMAMYRLHPNPVTSYEVENIVRRELQKARNDFRTLKNTIMAEMEGLRHDKENS